MIIAVWSLKRGIIDPPELLDKKHSDWVEKLWKLQDEPVHAEPISYWKTMRKSIAFVDR